MPKDPTLHKILVIGSGPIVIGQGCEFDYSGVQACKALKEEGYEVVLVNSNPATIMTDPEFAHRTYIEPITPEVVGKIIEAEKPDALLPTLGGQTALNCSMKLHELGVLQKHNVRMIGAKPEAIHKGEDRQAFKEAMIKIGLDLPRSGTAHTMEEGRKVAAEIGTMPLIIRPAFTLGGSGGGIAYNKEEFEIIVARGLDLSPVSEVLIEESLLGWKEFEMEVMRDKADNCVIICSIENVDPMGVHTGDSITVAPAQTLSDREYQNMRDASFAVIREIGVETGGSNIQFAIEPNTGRMIVIEMNPRVSRSSALASKATGFPIAKIAAKLAVGYTLDEVKNDITRETPASFEPTIDYVVVKVPRFTFEKFPQADPVLTTQMKSVGEAMAIGRTFKEALQKALRSLEIKRFGLIGDGKDAVVDDDTLRTKLTVPNAERIFFLGLAFQRGWTVEEVFELTKVDRWFLENIREVVTAAEQLAASNFGELVDGYTEADSKNLPFDEAKSFSLKAQLRRAKKLGFSDVQLSVLGQRSGKSAAPVFAISHIRHPQEINVNPTYRLVDTCAAEFEAYTPYYYSTYGDENERRESGKKKVIILGGGPNRIGQGIEFDYCCVHAAFALKELGFETIMVNSNPETVSTDYDTSDKLYFEPLTLEDVLNICEQESENLFGVIVQFGGQTPLNLAKGLEEAGVPIIGTSPKSIEIAEDRKLFGAMLDKLGIRQTAGGTAVTEDQAVTAANTVGYPVLVRPSFVLGGRGMQLVHTEADLRKYVREAIEAAPGATPNTASNPILVDHFLEDALEIDVDCISDGQTVVIGAIMEHIEEAGIHSGDSACAIPPFSLKEEVKAEITKATKAMAKELHVKGLMNVQFAVKDDVVYVLEVNPRASRTAPFVSKAIGVPLPKLAAKIMAGQTLQELGFTKEIIPTHYSVKEAVFPFIRFPGIDIMLGPEMKSTGEVMGIDQNLGLAYAKAQMAAQPALPSKGNIFISLADRQKPKSIEIARGFADLGFKLFATSGTAKALKAAGIAVTSLHKLNEGRPHALDMIKNGELALVINTPSGKVSREDEVKIRSTATANRIPVITTLRAARASLEGIRALKEHGLNVKPLQEWHGR
ncbi:carbamoyl-phosphate synthase, large subunit [Chthoniobacter flavus Ellin428]|uniref:Carbamoyl phosphate synthase large chain n=1 Tax=Chthoniobacter flavus Ellin428 TaxID=497964 RepID=B4CTQ9_9BACT|nr:carbamoyl-phosphate synthase large subunit [Chthoniobacter flavus]EDY21947.1 carbamoyl-phosphate synthase, large subunit [Chthoniobacter flavus Ellin428]TCO89335.1 carbamoyl-phosphate synthase large subunit [Chthoniobacter flavus]